MSSCFRWLLNEQERRQNASFPGSGNARARQRQRHLEEAQQAFSSARHIIATLAESIENPDLHERFEQAALATLPKEKPVSPMSSVLSKLGLPSRFQIALWARDNGLASREP